MWDDKRFYTKIIKSPIGDGIDDGFRVLLVPTYDRDYAIVAQLNPIEGKGMWEYECIVYKRNNRDLTKEQMKLDEKYSSIKFPKNTDSSTILGDFLEEIRNYILEP